MPDAPLPDAAEKFATRRGRRPQVARRRARSCSPDRGSPPRFMRSAIGSMPRCSAPVDFIAPVDPVATGHGESLRALADDIAARRRSKRSSSSAPTPPMTRPANSRFGEAIASVPFTAHLGLYATRPRRAALASAAVASPGKLVGSARLRRHREHRPAADPAALRHAHRA